MDDAAAWCLCCAVKSFFGCLACCSVSICGLFIGVVLICVLVPAFGVVYPVRATVRDVSVSHLALAGPNVTVLAYDLSFTVALRNRNWAMRAEHARRSTPSSCSRGGAWKAPGWRTWEGAWSRNTRKSST
ncbi:hypothetical protein BAE44_0013531 [Dichanthelium oligosanthes]|uniref:Late embryogenesis abundant protein LEA-2 subgroup domain-containing protein n=1 Tax=Dichanthelium oligosanthes TaxID=888268 RepID=A0A1E5VK15_9POAL|nr:hypothetical protein BAE44_0013531 [Dichanthelium oligosanthes]